MQYDELNEAEQKAIYESHVKQIEQSHYQTTLALEGAEALVKAGVEGAEDQAKNLKDQLAAFEAQKNYITTGRFSPDGKTQEEQES